jgi:uncharacterized membrane protein YhiD involved in acid resistance
MEREHSWLEIAIGFAIGFALLFAAVLIARHAGIPIWFTM